MRRDDAEDWREKRETSRRSVTLTVFGLVRFLASVSQLLRWLYVLLLRDNTKTLSHCGSRRGQCHTFSQIWRSPKDSEQQRVRSRIS